MTPLRTVLLLALCALASACATTGKGDAATAAPATAVVVDATPATVSADTAPASAGVDASAPAAAATDTAVPAQDATAGDAASDAESDFDAIYGQADASGAPAATAPAAYDPWEKYNRKVHAFNGAVDRRIARPLAEAYVAAVPQPIRTGVHNFFDNLGEPVNVVNSLLQGNPRGAANAFGRFLLNTTIGVGGLFDIATKVKMPDRGEDFGQTMAVWGWKRSRYIEVPFLGPRTLRDLFGLAADTPLRPLGHIEDDKTRLFLQGVQAVDLRAQLLSIEGFGEGAVDEYALYRDIWLQRRNYQINQAGRRNGKPDEQLPSYLLEDGGDTSPDAPAPITPPPAPAGN